MKSKILLLIIALTALSSCSTKGIFDYRKQQLLYDRPSISIKSMSVSDTDITMKGYCSCYGAQKIEYFFLCSTDETDFSKAEKKSAHHNGSGTFTGTFKPSAEGTYYVKFCADNRGLSYIESKVKAVEYAKVSPAAAEAIDLGLSVKWATYNVGASKPEDYGGYYQWAGTQDVTSTSINLDWDNCPYHTGSNSSTGWTKYNTISSYGTVDNKTVLEPSDDAAHVNWGGSWRMPTDSEWTELRNNCTWTLTTQNGVNGYKVTSKKTGYTSSSIFLPAAGYRGHDNIFYAGSSGYYLSSSLYTGYSYYACSVNFGSGKVSRGSNYRYYGQSVRPVSE